MRKREAILLGAAIVAGGEPITGGTGQISGTFSEEHARQLAALLRTGSLPAGLTLVSVEVVKGKP